MPGIFNARHPAVKTENLKVAGITRTVWSSAVAAGDIQMRLRPKWI